MDTTFDSSFNFSDLNGLAALRRAAASGKDKAQTLQIAARQMEGLFLQTLLKNMLATLPKDGLFGSDALSQYQEMFDQQLALDLAKKGGIGIAKQLQSEISAQTRKEVAHGRKLADYPRLPPARPRGAQTGQEPMQPSAPSVQGTQSQAIAKTSADGDFAPKSISEFVAHVAPYVEKAARALNIHPMGILAQTALETGWGRRMLQRADGSNALNFFGIKADERWSGDRVTAATLEVHAGMVEKTNAAFRAFDSMRAAFSDYVDFLGGDSRYESALQQGGDANEFAKGLQAAGYATDPKYAAKLIEIMDRPSVRAAVDRLTSWLR